ncbi:unnamed protein product [Blepharisma stoltei]|uniref:Tyrosine-protein kinase ephrin type A/B receptor-like domain-containing protein n=1 Tax=Blepharisma stoltei TaxID=1481888 RepID=A0AAU9J9F9_9CILI|nr:unnamed protein product [Blepharisma stoltei]
MYLQTFYLYDLSNNKWKNITSSNTYSPRIFYGSLLYNEELYLLHGYSNLLKKNNPDWYKVNLLDSNYEWSQVQLDDNTNGVLSVNSYGSTLYNSKILVFGGNQNPPIVNQLVIFDLEFSPIKYQVYDRYKSPSPRMYHSMQAMNHNLYLFGGLGANEELYNDLWTFNCIDDTWNNIDATGDIPSKRYGYASAANAGLMVVWGGYGANGYLNDGYILDITANSWHSMDYFGDAPSPRVGACGAQMGSKIAIYGGLTESGLSDELWVYDFTTSQYTLLDYNNTKGPGKLYYATCRMSTSTPNFVYVLYGEGEDEVPLNGVFTFNMSSKIWIANYTDKVDLTWARAKSSVYKLKTRILVIGGESFGSYPNSEIFYLDTSKNTHVQIGSLDSAIFAAAFAYFQNYVYIHGGGTAVGSLLRFNVPSNKFIRVHLWSDCADNTTCFWACSPGTYRTNNCFVCPPGTYSDGFNHTFCDKCLEGKYNAEYGATSKDLCYPCQEGTYNDQKGTARCLWCPYGSNCDVGSVDYNYQLLVYDDKSIQPAIYISDTNQIDETTFIIQSTVGFAGLLVIILFIFVKKGREFLEDADLYTNGHNHLAGQAMYLKKTKIGGLFSIIFIFIAIIAVGTALVNYSLNNVYEVKSLVPLVVLKQDVPEFIGDFIITVTLIHYGGTCTSKNDCSSELSHIITGINGSFSKSSCRSYDNGNCDITILCKSCEVLSYAQISYSMNNQNGYVSGFTVNVTFSSSIPNEKSSYEMTLEPSENHVFSGNTPSEVYFYTIPSLYSETWTKKNQTGYHVSLKQPSDKGSEYQAFELALAFNSYLNIKFDIGTNGLVTTRNVSQTFIILITTLLGSVFGIMGSIGGIMKLVEEKWINIEKKLKEKSSYEKSLENVEMISGTYERSNGLGLNEPDFSEKLVISDKIFMI